MQKLLWSLALIGVMQAGMDRTMWGAAPKIDPADYPLNVHVSGAEYAPNVLYQLLTVTIDGKHYQVEGPTSSAKAYMHGNGLLNLGDYHAKQLVNTQKTAYESIQSYELLMPDGTTRRFSVIAQSE
jgi:hypothetical protein